VSIDCFGYYCYLVGSNRPPTFFQGPDHSDLGNCMFSLKAGTGALHKMLGLGCEGVCLASLKP
jgi:hypothetical protein